MNTYLRSLFLRKVKLRLRLPPYIGTNQLIPYDGQLITNPLRLARYLFGKQPGICIANGIGIPLLSTEYVD